MATMTADERDELIADIRQHLSREFAPASLVDDLSALNGWKKKMLADGSFGRVFNGPQWLDGVAVRNGAISGTKLSATLVISNTFVTVDTTLTPTADRMEMTANGVKAYGTVSGVPNTQTLSIGATGDFTFGTTNPITYVASTGVLTVPAAVIGSLTIANVGAGILGGLYKTSASNAHLELDTAGIRAYNTAATKTFDMVSSTGELALTGNLTVGTGGKIKFGTSAADYLDNNILHFEVSTGEETVVETRNGSMTPYGLLSGAVDTGYAVQRMQAVYNGSGRSASSYVSGTSSYSEGKLVAQYDSNYYAHLQVIGNSTNATAGLKVNGGATNLETSIFLNGDATAASSSIVFRLNNNQVMDLAWTNRALTLAGYLYPGTGSASQSSRYLYDSGTLTMASSGLGAVGALYPNNQTTRSFGDNGTQLTTSHALVLGGNLYPGSGQTSRYLSDNGSYFSIHAASLTAGSPANWSAGWAAGGYFFLGLNGTTVRVPYFFDA